MQRLRTPDNRSESKFPGSRGSGRLGARQAGLQLEILEQRQMLTVDISGNGNTDAASLAADGGPGNSGQAGFVNVGLSPTGGASVTYLGNGWIITANHV